MPNFRKLKITPAKSENSVILFSIQGRSTNFHDGKPKSINIKQNGCYDVILVCGGNPDNQASVTFEAVHKDFGIYLCTPARKPTWTEIKKLEVKIPSGESASLVTSLISIRKKSDKPST